jgi:hypothetical protein
MATFDGDRSELSPFTEIGGDPPSGIAEAPALVSYGLAAGQVDVFVVSGERSIWKRSFNGAVEDPEFASLPSRDNQYGGIELTTGPYGGDVLYLTLTRRNVVDGKIEFSSLVVY